MVDQLPTSTGEFTGFLVAINSMAIHHPVVPKFKKKPAKRLTEQSCSSYYLPIFNQGIVGCTPTNVPLWEIPI